MSNCYLNSYKNLQESILNYSQVIHDYPKKRFRHTDIWYFRVEVLREKEREKGNWWVDRKSVIEKTWYQKKLFVWNKNGKVF